MKHSYIANDKEAALLHIGKQTAIIVPMKVQPEPPRTIYQQKDCYITVSDKPNLHNGNHGVLVYWKKVLQDGDVLQNGGTWKDLLPYALHQPVYVRESWKGIKDEFGKVIGYLHKGNCKTQFSTEEADFMNSVHWKSPATMPKSAARTWFVPVEVQAVRVRDITEEQAECVLDYYSSATGGDDYEVFYRNYLGSQKVEDFPWFSEMKEGWRKSLQSYIVFKFGQQAWDENHFVWLYKIKKQ